MSPITPVSPRDFARALAEGGCAVIDVRESNEVALERIPGAAPAPLSDFDRHAAAHSGGTVYVVCRSGKRARQAAERLAAAGAADVRVLAGGLQAWKAAGLPVEGTGVWAIERQVRFVAGLLVLAGFPLARFVHPLFIYLPALIGGGLAVAALTDSCLMGMLLARMPWNRAAPARATPAAGPADGAGPGACCGGA